jgi:tetratricopeptide (TPR) repeat protein
MQVREPDADIKIDPAQRETTAQPSDRNSSRSLFSAPLAALGAPLCWLRLAGPNRSPLRRGAVAVLVLGIAAWIAGWNGYAWYHRALGTRSLEAGESQIALKHFQSALRVWPDDAATQLLAARAAWRVQQVDLAEAYLKKCQSTSSLAEHAQFERLLLRASKGEIDAVGGVCQAMLVQQHPEAPLILEALALGNLMQLRLAQSAQALDRWLEIEPDNPQAIYLDARVHQQTGNNEDALAFFRRTVELDPERNDARLQLASLHLDLGQAQEAVPYLEEARRREPDNIAVQARLAQGLALLARTKEAAVLLDKVLLLRPHLGIALVERGKIALRDGDLEHAEQCLQQACTSEPGNRAAHYQLLQCLKQAGKTSEARAVQERLSQIDENSKRINDIITVELPRQRLDPDLHAELGELLLKAGAVDDGLRWLNRALQMDPRLSRAHRALAAHYDSLGQASLAQQHLALIDPVDAEPPVPQ